MGRIQSPAYIPALSQAAREDREWSVRIQAVFALGQMGLVEGITADPEANRTCLSLLLEKETDLLCAAVEALGKLAGSGTAESISPLLRHSSDRVRAEAAMALFRIRWVPVWRKESKEPPPLPRECTAALIQGLEDPSVEVRRACAYAFARYGEPDAVEALMLRVIDFDDDEWVRMFAIRALSRTKTREVLDGILAMISAVADRSERVRTEAVSAMAALNQIDELTFKVAQDNSFHVRAAYARGLASSTNEESLSLLKELLNDPSPSVLAAAIDSLARRLHSGFAKTLEELLEDPRATARTAAASALAHLGTDAEPLLRKAMTRGDDRVRAAALESLESLEGFDDLIREALSSGDLAVRGSAVAVLAKRKIPEKLLLLRRVYEDSSDPAFIEIRESVIDAAAETAEAQSFLLHCMKDPAASIRAKARNTLRKQGIEILSDEPPPDEPSPLLEATFEKDPVVVLETSKGTIEIRCLAKEAPVHVANFVDLVRKKAYDGLGWHRIVSNFVIQGGDPRGDGWGGHPLLLRDEINRTRYVRGAVGMPKAGKDTGAGQIFITHTPTPHLDGNYTVFGLVTSGIDVVDRIDLGDTLVSARLR